MSTIWFDVTGLLRWNRPAVGIIRMEAECARYALENLGSRITFCRAHPPRSYVVVSHEKVQRKIDEIIPKNFQNLQLAFIPATLTSRAEAETGRPLSRLATSIVRVLSAFPKPSGTSIIRYLSLGRNRLTKLAQRILRPASTGQQDRSTKSGKNEDGSIGQNNEGRAYPFLAHDLYLTVGLYCKDSCLSLIYDIKNCTDLKTLFCCYDIIPIKYPHLCKSNFVAYYSHYIADVCRCADEIVCISQCSKRDLTELLADLGRPQPGMTVIPLGSNLPPPIEEASAHIRETVGDRFVLFVSTIERRKNHETLYRAYTRLVDQGIENLPKMIFVGKKGWGIADLINDLRLDPRTKGLIEILTEVSDPDLAWLYRYCLFTVYPSLYEGWGLPVAESLAAGKYCLASNLASIPEVGGDLIEYLDPWNVPLWAERLQFYFEHPDELKRAEKRIREEYVATTWDDTAKALFERVESLLQPQKIPEVT